VSDIQVVTVRNRTPEQWYYWTPWFEQSLKRYGHTPLYLGQAPGEYRGLGSKPKLLKRAIEQGRIDREWLLFCDCFDLLFAGDPAHAPDVMKSWYPDAQMVIGGELQSFPDASLAALYPPAPTRFKYVNSGFMLARTEDFLKFLVEMNPESILNDGDTDENLVQVFPNDQAYTALIHIHGTAIRSQVDHNAALVVNLCGLEQQHLDFSPRGIRVVETNTYPLCIHANGGGKEMWHGKVLEHLKLA